MRILVVSQYFWPENFRINDLVTEFCDRGHEVTVLTGSPNYPSGEVFPEFRSNPGAYAKFGGASVVRVPMFPRGSGGLRLMVNYASFAFGATVFGAWRLRGQAFDVIFVFEPSPITVGLPAAFLRYLKGAPLAFWVLDLWPETLEAIGVVRSRTFLKAVGHLVTFIYNRCDLILAQSKSFIPQIRRYCGREKAVEYFPSWSDAEFDFSTVVPADEVPSADGMFSIMFAGNVGDAQDFPAILDAAEHLKDDRGIRWLIVGDGRASEWVRSEVTRRGLEHCFLLLGRYPVERMPSFFRHADALLVSLKDEPIFAMTIPGKLQSYLAAGIPVLAMLNGEGAEIVDGAGAGLSCPAGDGVALAAAVRKMAGMDIEGRQRMGRRGRAVSEQEFDRGALISRLLSWLENLSTVGKRHGEFDR
ncbi:MAG: glycosyltransferase family 4 protein [Dechloromonas sp.]|uniref:Glycosyltransferase family 4 protein n=1 Tax=Candidatus Dechloromonas phosphorivorans TaxID=2899244 RepID=A0A9D7QN35_9RHOO|nr:glycosyltransferase family 4 protein [Candidatus Dechloromonas phosphorivorans]